MTANYIGAISFLIGLTCFIPTLFACTGFFLFAFAFNLGEFKKAIYWFIALAVAILLAGSIYSTFLFMAWAWAGATAK